MSRLLRPLRTLPSRGLSPLTTTRHSSFLQNSPAPPRLPADQQAEFERLQRAAEAALSSHNTIPSSTPSSETNNPLATSRHVTTPSSSSAPPQAQTQSASAGAASDPSAGSFSGGMRQGAPPEFQGDTNPVTGEVGGPKNEPLRWGSKGDWSFNGRCTDF
ncbi:hypothetical protein NEMBOFW57_004702 [Staphylotrichum longicolle]|uniref:Succinate dehydrogenase assembly factor 4, mitochondrial n=1 Tax=Staphylotrichum longicolle TaxID=669026 RepID=A0AAD4F7B9_9PEZI|nr:hypothetical protein NEMBOFW57_004702 [Staphylotrichum longicolle]